MIFAVQYRPGRHQGHCDALSRCENPWTCDCPEQDTSESLKCGPCRKCVKRAQDMMHEQHYKKVVPKSPEHAEPREQAQVIQAVRHADQEVSVPGTSTETDGLVASTTVPVTPWFQSKSLLELKKMQEEDPDIEPVLKGMTNDRKPSSQDMAVKSPAARHYWILWDSVVLQDGLFCKMFVKKDGTGEHMQFIVPKTLKKEVLFQMHDSLLSGHLGCKKTKAKTLQRFYWYGLKDDIGIYIKKCDTCAADKKPTKIPRAPMGSLQTGAQVTVS